MHKRTFHEHFSLQFILNVNNTICVDFGQLVYCITLHLLQATAIEWNRWLTQNANLKTLICCANVAAILNSTEKNYQNDLNNAIVVVMVIGQTGRNGRLLNLDNLMLTPFFRLHGKMRFYLK